MFIIMWKSIQNSKAEADNVPVMWAGTAMETGVIQGLTRINKMYQKKKNLLELEISSSKYLEN